MMIVRNGASAARGRRYVVALLAAAFAVPAAPAFAGNGGVSATDAGTITAVTCRSSCDDDASVLPRGVVRIAGRGLGDARQVIFVGAPGNADDVIAPVRRARARTVDVRVPESAPSGRVRLRTADGAQSAPSTDLITVLPAPVAPTAKRIEAQSLAADDGAAPLSDASADLDNSDRIDGQVVQSKVFFGGFAKATLRYVVTGGAPLDVAVEVLRAGSTTPVARWMSSQVAPGIEQRIQWDGTSNGRVVPRGKYEFRIAPLTATAAGSDGATEPVVEDAFRFLDHKFPVRGPHDYGQSGARFGAGRAGHMHQGQDVMAPCGTPLVAARGGVVVRNAWQGNAGNYLVIDGDGTDVDYAYMHLSEPSLVAKGERVRTGQRIGNVGDTGDAHGCHLHFEMWSAPGWYEGGSPFDPLASLKAWDAES